MRYLWAGLCLLLSAMPARADSDLRLLSGGDEIAPFRAVGRLDLDGRGFCTATLLGADLILTAAHCVTGPEGRPVRAERLTFWAGRRDGLAAAQRRGRRVAVAETYDPARSDLANLASDLALVVLDRPVAADLVAPIPAARSAGRRVGVVSYTHDRAERPSIQEACEVLERREGALILTCLADFGASGAPVLRRGPDGLEIVSVVAAMAEADGRRVSIGSDLRALERLRDRIAPAAGLLARAPEPLPVLTAEAAREAGPGKFLRPPEAVPGS